MGREEENEEKTRNGEWEIKNRPLFDKMKIEPHSSILSEGLKKRGIIQKELHFICADSWYWKVKMVFFPFQVRSVKGVKNVKVWKQLCRERMQRRQDWRRREKVVCDKWGGRVGKENITSNVLYSVTDFEWRQKEVHTF